MSIESQIAALKDIWAVYHRHGILGPNNRQITFRDGDDVEMRRCFKAFLDGTEHGWEKQDKAQRLLLASGFPVPDHWLNLNVGEVSDSWKRDRGTTVAIHSVDEDGLDRAAKEISVAILRLEAAPRDGNSPPATQPAIVVNGNVNGNVVQTLGDGNRFNVDRPKQLDFWAESWRRLRRLWKCIH